MKRILSIILTAVIMLSLIPMSMFSAFAEGDEVAPPPEFSEQYQLSNDGTYYIVSGYSGYSNYSESLDIRSVYNGLPVKEIGDSAFYGCSSLSSITIPDSVTSIGYKAFSGCNYLTSVVIGNSVTSIGNDAFYGCYRLTSVHIPDSVTSIGSSAFDGCINLKYNEYSNGQYLGNTNNPYVVLFGVASTSIVSITIHNSARIISNNAFNGCHSLTSINIPDSVTSVGNNAFAYCYSLTSIEIPDSVTSIGSNAFSYCASLTSVHIPDSVTTMSDRVFESCFRITDVYCEAESKPDGWNPGWHAGFGANIHWGVKAEDINNELTFEIANIENSLFESDYAQDEWNKIQEAINKAKDFVTSGKSASEGEIRAEIDALQNALIINPKKAEFGDMTGDGEIGSLDYLYVKRACFGTYNLTVGQTARADINRSDKIDSADYLLVKRIAFGTYKVQ